MVANPKLEAQLRYKFMSHKFHNLAHKVAHSLECCVMLENTFDCLSTQLEDKLNLQSASATNETCEGKENDDPNELCEETENVDPNVQQKDDLLSAAQLKKEDVQPKKSRRNRTWIDKLRKGKKKNPKSAHPKSAQGEEGDSIKKVKKKKNPKSTQGAKVYKMQSAHLFMLVINRTN